MRRHIIALIATVYMGCVTSAAPPDRRSTERPTRVAQRVLDSIVVVTTPRGGHGTGWPIDSHTIVTARHVTVGGVARVTTRDGAECVIRSVRESADDDISIIDVTGCHLTALTLSPIAPTEGMQAHIAGHPRWRSYSWTSGTVSDADDGLVLDVVAEPGNSGGPVLDRRGRVIGMAVSITADPIATTWGGATFAVRLGPIVRFASSSRGLR